MSVLMELATGKLKNDKNVDSDEGNMLKTDGMSWLSVILQMIQMMMNRFVEGVEQTSTKRMRKERHSYTERV